MRWTAGLTGLSVLVLLGCSVGGGSEAWKAEGFVIEAPGHGPLFCESIEYSSPPQCSDGVELTNWDWDVFEGEQRSAGTTWGEYSLVGTIENGMVTVREGLGFSL